jgi:hypothetical protein
MKFSVVPSLVAVLLAGCAAPTAEIDDPLGQPTADSDLLAEADGIEGAPVPCCACHGCVNPKTGELSYDIPAPVVVTSPMMTLVVGEQACTFSGGTDESATFVAPCPELKGGSDTGRLYFMSKDGPMFVTIQVGSDASPIDP